MSGRTFADVDALDAVTADLLPTVPGLRDATDTYRRALHALRAAPSDLEVALDDHAPHLDDLADLLTLLDQLPAAFAFALRTLDHRAGADLGTVGCDVRTAGEEGVDRLAALRLRHPTATGAQLRSLFINPHAPTPPTRGAAHAHWLVGAIDELDHIAAVGGGRYTGGRATVRPGRVTRMMRTASRFTGPASAVAPAYEQHLADRDDHNLTDGDRAIGMATATAFEGGGALAGTAAGGKFGAVVGAVGGPVGVGVGTAVGAVGGALTGAWGGRRARQSDPVRSVENQLARDRDRRRGTGHQDAYEQDHGIRSGR